MKKPISINQHSVHLWRIVLSDFFSQVSELSSILSDDEIVRANRFKFEIHRQRFTVARSMLRRVLSHYLTVSPEDIEFHYGHRGKPYLLNDPAHLQFNLSHSDDMAVVALTINHEIGVDIEKVEPGFKNDVAKRFFSVNEYQTLMALPQEEQTVAFYRIWSKKEALIKALGEGLYAPLDAFSVSPREGIETVSIQHDSKLIQYHVQNFFVHDDYPAAFATDQAVKNIEYFCDPVQI